MSLDDINKIIEEYSENYCSFLEGAYGENMMSEGGTQAIDNMLNQESLPGKTALDIGFGLGGLAFYLAEQYDMTVHGVEINPWMVEEASQRTPAHLKKRVCFHHYDPHSTLAFADDSFDIVMSKGVLTHLQDKTTLFNQVARILKSGGSFVIDDWLSPSQGKWGPLIDKLCHNEGLTLYPETIEHYVELLKNAGFSHIATRDESQHYQQYNRDIVKRLIQQKTQQYNNSAFNNFSIDEAIESYQLIAEAIKKGELLVYWIRAEHA